MVEKIPMRDSLDIKLFHASVGETLPITVALVGL